MRQSASLRDGPANRSCHPSEFQGESGGVHPPRGRATPTNRVVIGQDSIAAERVIAALREHGLID